MKMSVGLWGARKYGIKMLMTAFTSKSTEALRKQMACVVEQRPGRWNKASQHGTQ